VELGWSLGSVGQGGGTRHVVQRFSPDICMHGAIQHLTELLFLATIQKLLQFSFSRPSMLSGLQGVRNLRLPCSTNHLAPPAHNVEHVIFLKKKKLCQTLKSKRFSQMKH
jgi:hypothetical protein